MLKLGAVCTVSISVRELLKPTNSNRSHCTAASHTNNQDWNERQNCPYDRLDSLNQVTDCSADSRRRSGNFVAIERTMSPLWILGAVRAFRGLHFRPTSNKVEQTTATVGLLWLWDNADMTEGGRLWTKWLCALYVQGRTGVLVRLFSTRGPWLVHHSFAAWRPPYVPR